MSTAQADRGLDLGGLPSNVDAERVCLGSILLDATRFLDVSATLRVEDFALHAHRVVLAGMTRLFARGEPIDRVTLANELLRTGQLESIGGLTYLCSLDADLPILPNVSAYCRIIQEKSRLRRIIYHSQIMVQRALDHDADPDDILRRSNSALLDLEAERTDSSFVSPVDVLTSFPGGMNAFCTGGVRAAGIPTGFRRYDQLTGGLHKGDLVVIAGRPSMGKTALALTIADYISQLHRKEFWTRGPQGVAFFSLEMEKESLVARLLCASARVNTYLFRSNALSPEERLRLLQAANSFGGAPLYLDDTSLLTPTEIHARLRKLQTTENVAVAIVDYLGLLDPDRHTENRVQEISAMTRALKKIAKSLNLPVVVLSQLSRACETRSDKRPLLSDLRDSGQIEADADVVVFVYRPSVYQPDREDLRGTAELIIRKQRNGPTGVVKLVFNSQLTRFYNTAEDLEDLDDNKGGTTNDSRSTSSGTSPAASADEAGAIDAEEDNNS